ncbi:MAG: DUF2318 domain-containing protein [Treponema sp.]|jgi:uncharacterized membrane protein|nr:DUF2318 domain-containing protein [Treponema sp.]
MTLSRRTWAALFALALLGGAAAGGFAQAADDLNKLQPLVKDADLVITVADVGADARFYPVDVDGTRIEVLVVKAPDGTIRTAFNTCQACYASGRGFYKQQGTVLVCQNCGRRFRMSQVEVDAGGCNPLPIFAADKRVTAKTITVPLATLKKAKGYFRTWKRR